MSDFAQIQLSDLSPQTVTYSPISIEQGKSIRSDFSRGVAFPRTLVVAHSATGKNHSLMDRHLFRLNDVKEDASSDSVSAQSASVYLVVEKPRRIVTDADIISMIQQITAYFGVSANITEHLAGKP